MSRRRGRRLTGFLLAAASAVISAGAVSAQSDSVVLEVQSVGSCADLATQVGSATSWRGLRLEAPRVGIFSDRHMTVELREFSGSDFTWSSDTGLDAVLIGYQDDAGSAQLVYLYEPESTDDAAVGISDQSPSGVVTSLTFCHDVAADASAEASSTTTSTTAATTTSTTSTTSTTVATTSTTVAASSTTTHDDETADELAKTGADSIVLFPLGLVLVGLGVALVAPLRNRRESQYPS
ncbi:MAG: hypothetical protein ACC652_00790 [Acidimicrobiales bacterium]